VKFLDPVEFEDVLTEWAKREEKQVYNLLLSRGNMISRLPLDTQWFKVELAKQDLPLLRLIKDLSWNDLSAFTGDIEIAANNFQIYTKVPLRLPPMRLPDGRTRQEYFDTLLRNLRKFRKNAGNPKHNLTLIMVSSSTTKPFTNIEGNHTAMALYFRYFVDRRQLTFPTLYAYAGVSMGMSKYPWFHLA
jgi:hypothetical protein